MVHPNNFPRFVPIATYDALACEAAQLRSAVAELQQELTEARQQPLIAIAPDERVQELEAENARLKRRIEAVRGLLKTQLKGGAIQELRD